MKNFKTFLEQRTNPGPAGGLSTPAHRITQQEREQAWATRFRGQAFLHYDEPWLQEYRPFREDLKRRFLAGEMSIDQATEESTKKIQELRLKYAGNQVPQQQKPQPLAVPTVLNSAIDELQQIVDAYKRDGNEKNVMRAIGAWHHRWHGHR